MGYLSIFHDSKKNKQSILSRAKNDIQNTMFHKNGRGKNQYCFKVFITIFLLIKQTVHFQLRPTNNERGEKTEPMISFVIDIAV